MHPMNPKKFGDIIRVGRTNYKLVELENSHMNFNGCDKCDLWSNEYKDCLTQYDCHIGTRFGYFKKSDKFVF